MAPGPASSRGTRSHGGVDLEAAAKTAREWVMKTPIGGVFTEIGRDWRSVQRSVKIAGEVGTLSEQLDKFLKAPSSYSKRGELAGRCKHIANALDGIDGYSETAQAVRDVSRLLENPSIPFAIPKRSENASVRNWRIASVAAAKLDTALCRLRDDKAVREAVVNQDFRRMKR